MSQISEKSMIQITIRYVSFFFVTSNCIERLSIVPAKRSDSIVRYYYCRARTTYTICAYVKPMTSLALPINIISQ